MKLRLIEPGFENYEGQMGVVFFENGLSVSDVRPNDAIRMSAVMQCTWEDGSSASVSQAILDNSDVPAPIMDENYNEEPAKLESKEDTSDSSNSPSHSYTLEELHAIADKEGIKGLRKIAQPLGIKSNSVKELINAIVKK